MLAKVKIQYGISKSFVQPLTQITNLKESKHRITVLWEENPPMIR